MTAHKAKRGKGKTRKIELATVIPPAPVDLEKLRRRCTKSPASLMELATFLCVGMPQVREAIEIMVARGINITQLDDGRYIVHRHTPKTPLDDPRLHWVADGGGMFRCGIISDQHYGSAYAREDVAEDLYDWFAAEGITRVYNAGNWIEGEGKHTDELLDPCHGMQNQLDYCAAKWPSKPGIVTYFVAGDDHEGWYEQREHISIGRALEDARRRAVGADPDLVFLGWVESFIHLVHPDNDPMDWSLASSMLIQHPGGGSSYASSYKPQKLVESLQGGEKPGVYVVGHYHKIAYWFPRGVHTIMAGSCKEQDTFLRKLGVDSQVGGCILEFRIDPGGAISMFTPRFQVYRDKRYHAFGRTKIGGGQAVVW